MIHHPTRAALSRAALWIRQMQVMTGKEIRQLGRDRALLLFIIYIFTVNIILAAGEGATELHGARLVVHDADRSAASRELAYRFRAPYFHYAGHVAHPEQGLRRLERGEVRMMLDIPEQFEKTLRRGEQPTHVQLLVDTSQSNTGYLASSYGARIAAGMGQEWAQRNLASEDARATGSVEIRPQVWYNPALNDAWFGTIAELLQMITIACLMLPAAALIREKEHGTIEQLLVSPLTPLQVMLSKILSMTLVTLTGTAISLFVIMRPLYGVPARGSLELFFLLTALYVFTNASMGLVAATFTRSSGQVGMLVLLVVLPMMMLSEIRTPLESMPSWLHSLIQLNPLQQYIEVAYGILLRGNGLTLLWASVLGMMGQAAVMFGLAMWRFRRQFHG
jgi:ABC-2 type transport system permease protein